MKSTVFIIYYVEVMKIVRISCAAVRVMSVHRVTTSSACISSSCLSYQYHRQKFIFVKASATFNINVFISREQGVKEGSYQENLPSCGRP